MNKLLENIQRIGHVSGVLCVLKALRSKIELNRDQPNRLTKHFPNLKMCILVGAAGTGKTHIARTIFDGLNLSRQNKLGVPIGVWIEGAATVAGRREKFREHPNACLFWNEMNVGDINDVRLLKQVSEGIIGYYKHNELEETKFAGLVVGTTNDFSAKGRVGRDLESLRDRIDLVEIGPPAGYQALLAIEDKKHYYTKQSAFIDWGLISGALVVENDEKLTEKDIDRIRPFWRFKIRECLDDRVLTRAGYDFVSCFTFMKRIFGSLDDDDVFDAAVSLAYESVCISAIPLANLSVMQKDIVGFLTMSADKTESTKAIGKHLEERGRYLSRATMHRSLHKLVEKGFIIKIKHGSYSLLRPEPNTTEKAREFDQLLELL